MCFPVVFGVHHLFTSRQVCSVHCCVLRCAMICNICCSGTSLMSEVFINDEVDPYVLEIDGTLDLAGLNLQPASIVINKSVTFLSQTADSSWPTGADSKQVDVCSKKGLVDAQTCKTKRSLADIQQNVLHDTAAGSKASPSLGHLSQVKHRWINYCAWSCSLPCKCIITSI